MAALTACQANSFGHVRKLGILLLNALVNHNFVYKTVGLLNKRWHFLSSVFVAYPASADYARAYVYERSLDVCRWSPWPVGLLWQNGKLGLMLVISSTEEDFLSPANYENLKVLAKRTEHIQHLLGASQKTFAGILPGVLFGKRLVRESIEREVTVEAVFKAEQEVRDAEGYDDTVPLIILGGRGFIGRRLVAKLELHGRKVHCVDINSKESCTALWPAHLTGTRAILINATKKAVLKEYVSRFWPELVLLNEVYPEPSDEEIDALTKLGSPAYHVVGVEAKSYPPFPKAYAGAIPCCAARLSNNMQVVVKKLNS